jgi:hypothetical protein
MFKPTGSSQEAVGDTATKSRKARDPLRLSFAFDAALNVKRIDRPRLWQTRAAIGHRHRTITQFSGDIASRENHGQRV